jgi:hypothetical protein
VATLGIAGISRRCVIRGWIVALGGPPQGYSKSPHCPSRGRRSVPVTTMSMSWLPQPEQTSRCFQSGTVVSAPTLENPGREGEVAKNSEESGLPGFLTRARGACPSIGVRISYRTHARLSDQTHA